MNFEEYINYINRKKIDNTLYYYYIYKAIKGNIDFSIDMMKLKKDTNREWVRKSRRIIKNETSYKVRLFIFNTLKLLEIK